MHKISNKSLGSKLKVLLLIGMCLGFSAGLFAFTVPVNKLVLVEPGVNPLPVIIPEGSSPMTLLAVNELAAYIEKISGAKPEIIEGLPDPVPEQAIWVGFQPKLKEIFPDLDFEFKHPEEILISCDGKNVVIAGRDRWDPNHMTIKDRRGKEIVGVQQEYGTVNAVYTFLQDQLGVRWLWPGELGTDIIQRERIALEPFTVRYHPQIRGRRNVFMLYTLEKASGGSKWARHQRLQLDSLYMNPGHPFHSWWDRFHETQPEYFALQPDGSRGTPGGHTAKLCETNPAVWEEWMRDVDIQMATYPNQLTFATNPNDGWTSGYCTCEACRAWDHPDAKTISYERQGKVRTYVAMADRQLTFTNTLARKLRERFPDRDDLLVSALAYGVSVPPPEEVVPEENVIVNGVWSFHNQPNDQEREWFVQWSKIAPRIGWRPNLTSEAGWKAGFPNSAPHRVIEDVRFAAEHGIVSLSIDWIFDCWATQGPHYYMLAQMAWNPYADGEAILADYYQRAFGPAAETMIGYWDVIGNAATQIGYDKVPEREVWNQEFLDDAYTRLDKAAKEVAKADEKYAKRVAFVRAGLDYLRMMLEMQPFIDRMVETGGKDADAKAAAQAKWDENWEKIKLIPKEHPFAINGYCVTPGFKYLQQYSPDQKIEVLEEDKPGFR